MNLKNYDYYLIILTTLILFGAGAVSLYGITYYNYLAVDSQWTGTVQYSRYIDEMNSYLYPFMVLLLISLGLCIPKRLFDQNILIKFSGGILGITIILTVFSDIETGLGFLLAVMAIVSAVVLILTVKKSRILRFEKEGHTGRIGSSLLHFGFTIIILNFVSLRESSLHIIIFWCGVVFITLGNVLSFYPEKITSLYSHS